MPINHFLIYKPISNPIGIPWIGTCTIISKSHEFLFLIKRFINKKTVSVNLMCWWSLSIVSLKYIGCSICGFALPDLDQCLDFPRIYSRSRHGELKNHDLMGFNGCLMGLRDFLGYRWDFTWISWNIGSRNTANFLGGSPQESKLGVQPTSWAEPQSRGAVGVKGMDRTDIIMMS